jgi:20S proteasome subunit alpha 6
LQSKTHVVLASLNKAENELSSANKKVFKIDDHMGIAISGVIPDGRILCKYMRNQCLSHKCAPLLDIIANSVQVVEVGLIHSS